MTVGALAVVNSAGEVVDRATGLPWMTDLVEQFGLRPPPAEQIEAFAALPSPSNPLDNPLNTVIAVVATDAALSAAAWAHTPVDGDTVFVLATGAVEVPPEADTPAAFSPETRLATEVGVAVLAADSVAGIPSYRDVLPGGWAGERRPVALTMLAARWKGSHG